MTNCLVVDDSKVVRMVARKILEGLSFEIQEAEDGQEALSACFDAMPDVVLLDWHMPVKTGIEFLKELRAMVDGEKPIVLFCTSQTDLEHIHEALDAGANEYIMKPFDSDIIASKFSQVGLL
jgi:two-component system chemotaxis response regulator CheY